VFVGSVAEAEMGGVFFCFIFNPTSGYGALRSTSPQAERLPISSHVSFPVSLTPLSSSEAWRLVKR